MEEKQNTTRSGCALVVFCFSTTIQEVRKRKHVLQSHCLSLAPRGGEAEHGQIRSGPWQARVSGRITYSFTQRKAKGPSKDLYWEQRTRRRREHNQQRITGLNGLILVKVGGMHTGLSLSGIYLSFLLSLPLSLFLPPTLFLSRSPSLSLSLSKWVGCRLVKVGGEREDEGGRFEVVRGSVSLSLALLYMYMCI